VTNVPGINGNRERHQRDNPQHMRPQEVLERKEESGQAG